MGKQILFHALPEDCSDLLAFMKGRDPVEITFRDTPSSASSAIADPCQVRETMVLWNKALAGELAREYIAESTVGPYYRVDDAQPVLELIASKYVDWHGAPALLQGRIWGSFKNRSKHYQLWFEAIVSWIRRHYARNDSLEGYVAPRVQEWQGQGGILLPMFNPPDTPAWRRFIADQQRDVTASRLPN